MERCGKRRGFSRRAGLGFSGTTATARVFGTEAAAPRRELCPSVPRLSVPRGINRVAPLGARIAVDGQKRGRNEKMTAPPPRPSPKWAGVRGKAALRVGTLQAFPRLPRLGQSPRVTSNPVMRGRGKPRCDYVKGTPPVYMPPGFCEDRKLVLDGKPGGFVLNPVVRAEILKTLNQRATALAEVP